MEAEIQYRENCEWVLWAIRAGSRVEILSSATGLLMSLREESGVRARVRVYWPGGKTQMVRPGQRAEMPAVRQPMLPSEAINRLLATIEDD